MCFFFVQIANNTECTVDVLCVNQQAERLVNINSMYRISSNDSAPLIFRHVVAEMCTKPPNFGKHFGSSSQ